MLQFDNSEVVVCMRRMNINKQLFYFLYISLHDFIFYRQNIWSVCFLHRNFCSDVSVCKKIYDHLLK